MASSNSSGTQSATIDTEHTLAAVSTAGSFALLVDLNALVIGDSVTLRIKAKVTSGGTTRLAYEATYSHVQQELVAISIPVPSVNECVFTLEQTDGTERSFPWEIVEL